MWSCSAHTQTSPNDSLSRSLSLHELISELTARVTRSAPVSARFQSYISAAVYPRDERLLSNGWKRTHGSRWGRTDRRKPRGRMPLRFSPVLNAAATQWTHGPIRSGKGRRESCTLSWPTLPDELRFLTFKLKSEERLFKESSQRWGCPCVTGYPPLKEREMYFVCASTFTPWFVLFTHSYK